MFVESSPSDIDIMDIMDIMHGDTNGVAAIVGCTLRRDTLYWKKMTLDYRLATSRLLVAKPNPTITIVR